MRQRERKNSGARHRRMFPSFIIGRVPDVPEMNGEMLLD